MTLRQLAPTVWPKKRLKFCATYNDDVLPESTDDFTQLEYVEISDVSLVEGIRATTSMLFHEAPSRARRRVRAGDILVSTVRTYLKAIATVKEAPDNMVASTGFCVIRPTGSLDPEYAGWVAKSDEFVDEVVSRSIGVSYPAVNASQVVDIAIPIPPAEAQRRIAAFLNDKTAQIDALIANKRTLLERLAEKRQAIITRAVTKGLNPAAPMKYSGIKWMGNVPAHWSLRRLKFGTTKIGSGVTPRGGASVYVDDGVMLLRSQNIHFDGLRLDDVVYIDEDVDRDMAETRVKLYDVLLNITGASIGRCCVFDRPDTRANVNQHVCIVRTTPDMSPNFVGLYLSSQIGQLQIDLSQNGASREGLNFDDLGSFVLTLPTPPEQQEIASRTMERVAELDRQCRKVRDSIALLAQYRSSMISAAIAGQIERLQ
jgi:type I restriction enzyme S subunit